MKTIASWLLSIAAASVIASCSDKTPQENQVSYKLLTIKRDSATLVSEYSARLTGRQVVEVRPQVSGLITRICIGEGDRVAKGQLLFVIDQAPYKSALNEAEAAVANAEASLSNARLTLSNQEKLHAGGVIGDYELSTARNNLIMAEASLREAKAKAETARTNLAYTEVRSPVSGKAGMIAYRVGALVGSSIDDPLVTVSDDSVIQAYFSMTEAQTLSMIEAYGSVEAFMEQMPEVGLRLSNGKTYSLKGRIGAVSGIVSSANNAVSLRADFANPQGLLREGGSGSVIVPSVKESCILIPQTATYELQDRIFAYKVVGGRATGVGITVFRLNDGQQYVVESGLEEGDTIVAEGAGLLKEGQQVVF